MKTLALLSTTALVGALATVALTSAPQPAGAGAGEPTLRFAVTVTNLTYAQPLSPILVATHNSDTRMFAPGGVASPGLRLLAEDGMNSLLASELSGDPYVGMIAAGAGPIPPGGSDTVVIEATRRTPHLSLATMLVNTNDAFAGLDGVLLPTMRSRVYGAPAYDAGTEANNESCDFIPGPACGSGGVPDPDGAEGFVHVHRGIHGGADLIPAVHDWRNPAASVRVRRIP